MIQNKTMEKLASLIAQGEKLVMSASCPDGVIGVPVVSRIEFESWMGDVNTFNERQLKMHPQYNSIHTAFFHRRNHKRNCEEMVGLLRSVAQDTDFWETRNTGSSQQNILSLSKEVPDLQPTVFISHRSTDAKVADMIRDFLVGTGIPNDCIFCTSLPGNDVHHRISPEVKEKIKYSSVNIALLSDDYYNSAYCINEAGIIWLREDATPIVIGMPEITHDNMLGFLNNDYKLRRLNSDDDIAAIYDTVQKAVGVPPASMSVVVNASHKLKENYDAFISSRKIESRVKEHPNTDILDLKRVAEVKGERHSELQIVGIDQNQHLNDEAPIIRFVPNNEMTTSKYLERIRSLFDDISARKLEKRIEASTALSSLSLALNQPVEVSEGSQQLIRVVAKQLEIDIPEDFFVLGNLSRSAIPTDVFGGTSLVGTDAEKEKYETILELLETISNLSKWMPIEKEFAEKKCLRLALQNSGTDIDEDIEISLRIPKNSLLPINEFPKLNNDEMDYLLNECDMNRIFGICSTSAYSDYASSIVTTRRPSPLVSMPSVFPGYTRNYSDDFENELAEIFCYSCFDDGEEYIVKLKIDYIKHNTTVAFPSVIFIKEPFESIPYSITSKNSPDIVNGEVKIVDDTQNQ